jgi:hypothetical protein
MEKLPRESAILGRKKESSMSESYIPVGDRRESFPQPAGRGSDSFLIFSSSIVFFLFASLLVSSVAFVLRFPITSGHFFMAAGMTLLYAIVSCFLHPGWNRFFNVSLVLILLISSFWVCLLISRSFFDLSYDGQDYHQEAIIQISQGWNPFYEQLTSAQSNDMHRWLNHYSKGVWVYATMIFKVTKDIESGKLFHFWLMVAALFVTLSFLLRFQISSRYLAVFISFLVAFNPVSIYQSLSFYLDGQLMSLMIILIGVLGFIYREPKGIHYFFLVMVISILVNVKLTAGIYSGLILIGYLGMLWVRAKFEQFRKTLIYTFFAFLLGFVLFGYNPYVTNTLRMGNPFYPALGTDRADYTYPQFPANFIGKDSVSLLFYSIFSKSDNVRGTGKMAYLKIPFIVSKDELGAFTDTNAKQGGFGPLFGGAILLSLSIIIGILLILYSRSQKTGPERNNLGGEENAAAGASLLHIYLGLFILALVLATCVINPASSLARFIPQMWLFPVITVLLAYSLKNRGLRILGHLILLVLVFNNVLIGYSYYSYNLKITRLYNQRLERMAALSQEEPLHFYFGHFRSSNTLRFDRFGIVYSVVEKKEECPGGKRILPNSIILECRGE